MFSFTASLQGFFSFRSAGLVSPQTNRWSVRVILFLVFLFLFVVEHEMGRGKKMKKPAHLEALQAVN